MTKKQFFRNILFVMIAISALLLTACGGGGGGGTAAVTNSTSKVNVTIPGSLFDTTSGDVRAQVATSSKMILKVTAYLSGKSQTDIKIADRDATFNGTDYKATIDGLANLYDYRFTAFYNNKEVLNNQVSSTEIVNDASFAVNIDTSFKTLAYDSWLKKNPTNASMKNFKDNSKEAGYTKDSDYNKLTLNIGNENYTAEQFASNLKKVAKGENASLPTSTTSTINVDKIATTDKGEKNEQTPINNSLVGTWYLNEEDGRPVVPNSKGDVSTMILNSNGTCTMIDFNLTDYNHTNYWEPEGIAETDTGRWSYSNGKLTTVIDGYTMTVSVSLKDGSLTLTGNTPESWTSVYKKIKYELQVSPTQEENNDDYNDDNKDNELNDTPISYSGKYSQEISSIYSAMNTENYSSKSAEQQFVAYTRASAKYLDLIAKMLDAGNKYSIRISSIYSAMNTENYSSKSAYQQAVAYTRGSAKYLDLISTILDTDNKYSIRISSIYSAMNTENYSSKSAIQQVVAYTRGSAKYLDLIATILDKDDKYSTQISSIYSAMNTENYSSKSAYQQAVAYTRGSAKYLDLIATILDKDDKYSIQISSIYSAMNIENYSSKSAIQQKVAFSRATAKYLRIIALIHNE